jgi:tellurite methyltransferase
MTDVEYWKTTYGTTNIPVVPSKFAKFTQEFLHCVRSVIEIGSGNGRDAYFWGETCQVHAFDNAVLPENTQTVTFHKKSMREISGQYDLMYSRFSIHSIPEDIEDYVLSFAKTNCKYIAIECRTDKDEIANQLNEKNEAINKTTYADAHYRRYINFDQFETKLKGLGFNILFSGESDTYAPYKGYKPFCLRIIAEHV